MTVRTGQTVISRGGAMIGQVVGERACTLESCGGLCLGVRWPNGRLTWPCTKGMDYNEAAQSWQIV